jgi:alpha-1,3(6)-mannosylglycoprotein beta-1,6-N-acetyl-glucosaminyltransferase
MTLEKSCTEHDVVPQNQRKDEVVVLGKLFGKFTHWPTSFHSSNMTFFTTLAVYFYPDRISAALPTEVWPSFQDETWLVPIANAHALDETDLDQETPEGLVNRGPLSMSDYNDQVAHAKAYLGIGRPDISPSPYLAL